MIKFINLSKEKPYNIFKNKYDQALAAEQKNIEAICISSYSIEKKEINSRFVNLKFLNDKELIFFSNYRSPKSKDFHLHDQVSAVIFWNSINVQIRIKSKITKTSKNFNNKYFEKRDSKKNALAISSRQSCIADSYDDVKENFNKVLRESNLQECPDYWGGYSLRPYYFEFWEGHRSRLNKRVVYEAKDSKWISNILQP